jgi:hypothetical protein
MATVRGRRSAGARLAIKRYCADTLPSSGRRARSKTAAMRRFPTAVKIGVEIDRAADGDGAFLTEIEIRHEIGK